MSTDQTNAIDPGSNHLFPVFLKLEELNVLLVGAGKVGLEKLQAVIQNSPSTNIVVVAREVSEGVKQISEKHINIKIKEKPFEEADLDDREIVIIAVNDPETSSYIR